MDKEKRKRLEKAGWNVSDTQEFLGLSDEEMQLIELKIQASELLKNVRKEHKITQEELAIKIGSSQPRIASMESGEPNFSFDLMMKAFFAINKQENFMFSVKNKVNKRTLQPKVELKYKQT